MTPKNENAPEAATPEAQKKNNSRPAHLTAGAEGFKALPPRFDAIPAELKHYKTRWAPWEAKPNTERGKVDKVPRNAKMPSFGVSTHKTWWSFDEAVAGFETLDLIAQAGGVGFNLTRIQDLIGIDLDHCVEAGMLASWAREVVERSGSYAELSPSGRGVRLFLRGTIPSDWTNHERGIECYAGHAPRFLTVTGHRIEGSAKDVQPAPTGFVEWLEQTYKPVRTSAAPMEVSDLPDLVPSDELPRIGDLNLPPHALAFLCDGDCGSHGDRSRALAAATRALCEKGFDDATVLSLLWANEHAQAVALSHRRDEEDRGLEYVWKHHVLAQRAKAEPPIDDFEDLGSLPAARGQNGRPRFAPVPLAELLSLAQMAWLIKRVLPRSGLGVIYGESGSGKTFAVLDLALALAQGKDWRGLRTKRERVAYVCAEGAAGLGNRLRAYQQVREVDLRALPFLPITDVPNLLQADDVALAEQINAADGAGLVVIDTLAQTTPGGDENSSESMGRALAHCRRLGQATGALVLLVHHAGKDLSKGARGWSGLKAAADVELLVERDRATGLRQLTVSKLKDGQDGATYGFRLQPVVLGVDEDGDEVTSCVVEHVDEMPARREPQGKWQRAVWRAAHDLIELGNDSIPVETLIGRAIEGEPYDPGSDPNKPKRDSREESARRAIEALHDDQYFVFDGKTVELPQFRKPPQSNICGIANNNPDSPQIPHVSRTCGIAERVAEQAKTTPTGESARKGPRRRARKGGRE